MTTDLLAVIEYQEIDYGEPFHSNVSTWDFTNDFGLLGCKPYRFIAAISGWRRDLGYPHLFPLRGLPDEPHYEPFGGAAAFDDPGVGWLLYDEILLSLKHDNLDIGDVGIEVELVLKAMKLLVDQYGQDRVRLVFQIA